MSTAWPGVHGCRGTTSVTAESASGTKDTVEAYTRPLISELAPGRALAGAVEAEAVESAGSGADDGGAAGDGARRVVEGDGDLLAADAEGGGGRVGLEEQVAVGVVDVAGGAGRAARGAGAGQGVGLGAGVAAGGDGVPGLGEAVADGVVGPAGPVGTAGDAVADGAVVAAGGSGGAVVGGGRHRAREPRRGSATQVALSRETCSSLRRASGAKSRAKAIGDGGAAGSSQWRTTRTHDRVESAARATAPASAIQDVTVRTSFRYPR